MVNALTFTFAACSESNDHEVRPWSGETDLLESAPYGPYLGLDPPEFFRQPSLRTGGEALIGRCGCGVVGCGDSIATVELSGDRVIWVFSKATKVEFDRVQYFAAIASGAADTTWESVERTAERLVEALDFSAREQSGRRFQWASARIKRGLMTLSFLENDKQRLVEIGWDQADPEDACRSVRRWLLDGNGVEGEDPST